MSMKTVGVIVFVVVLCFVIALVLVCILTRKFFTKTKVRLKKTVNFFLSKRLEIYLVLL